MMQRSKNTGDNRPIGAPWLAAAMLGLAIQTLASSAVLLGAGLALGKAVTTPRH